MMLHRIDYPWTGGRKRFQCASERIEIIFNVREATVGCVAADCNPAHKKHRPFDSDRVHQFC